jgi:simple sugar transport system ATP-binding protein
LVGDNAAGKSTLMKVLAGLYTATDGEILVDRIRAHFRCPKDARERGIEMLFQDLALVPELDVAENLFLGREISKRILGRYPVGFLLDRKAMRFRAAQFLDELGIHVPSVREKVRNLSGGQQQSIAIARTIFFSARLAILDEPTSAISIRETRRVLELIRELKRKAIAAVVVSHRMEDIFSVADRIVVLRRGHKVEDVRREDTNPEHVVRKIIGAEAADAEAVSTAVSECDSL